jgi:hypothetical protein
MVSGKGKAGKRAGMEFEMSGNDFEFGLRLADFVIGWSGFSGAFNPDKLVAFFKKFPTVCEAFGSGAGGAVAAAVLRALQPIWARYPQPPRCPAGKPTRSRLSTNLAQQPIDRPWRRTS